MAHILKLRQRAILDLGEAYEWYEDKKEGLGEEFLLVAEDGFNKIQRNPELFEERFPGIKVCSLRRFPYCIYYKNFEKQIAVLAVYHQSRKPRHSRRKR